MKLCPTALILSAFALCHPALSPRADAAPDLLRYNLTVDATACGNTEGCDGRR